jgi:CRP-like cAMP-binding protein/Fe-S-cluster-containing dehydrogenase component
VSETFLFEETLRSEDEGLFSRDVNGRLVRMDKATADDYGKQVTVTIDGRPVTVPKAVPSTDSQGNPLKDAHGMTIPRDTTIYDAASKLFVHKPGDHNPIPILCHQEHMKPVAVCRLCVVEIWKMKRGKVDRERKLLPACQHRVEETMEVHTIESPNEAARERVRSSVRVLTELLMADHLRPHKPGDQGAYNELAALARRLEIKQPRFARGAGGRGADVTSAMIAVDHDSCVLCDRCVRACDDVKKNFIIGRAGKGYGARIAFDLGEPMGESGCVSCGECMISCPTGALTFRGTPQSRQPGAGGEVLSAAEVKQHPLFAGVSYKFLEWNTGAVTRRRLRPGEVLCREGDHGNTAFIMVEGDFQISIRSALKQVQTQRASGLAGLLGRIRTNLTAGSGGDAAIRSDGGAALSHGKPVAVRTPEDVILGEMTCMSHYPRSATVTAIDDAVVLEITRNVLYVLQRNKVARDVLDRVYRERALSTHLQSMPLFAKLGAQEYQECAAFLRERVELIRVDPGDVIFRQGMPADHFYMVRLGFVKVTQERMGQSCVLDYLGPGRHFGEIGLLSALSGDLADKVPSGIARGIRTATCSALDDVELVRVSGEHFRALLDRYPELREQLIRDAARLLEANAEATLNLRKPLGDFLEQGLFNAQKLLVIDLEKCTRCDECTRACADSHDGVTRLIREGLRFENFLVASSCRSCLDPYCLVGCPVDAIHRQPGSLEIVIEKHCIGCGLCAKNCPYGNINMHTFSVPGQNGRIAEVRKATTCDLCREVVRPGEDPSCVYACPHDAAFRWSGQDLLRRVEWEPRR